jgi:hypothetical protein
MTACLPLQDCIVQTTRLPAYGRKILLLRCSPANKATGLRPYNFAPQHGSCPAAVAVSQTAYKRSAVTCSGRIPNCMHTAAVALLQWQDTKLPLAVAGYQTAICSDRIPNCHLRHTRRLLPCCSGKIPNCMRAWLPCYSVRLSNCFIE